MLALGLGAAVAGGAELGAGDGVAAGKHAVAMSTTRRKEAVLTFVV